MPNQPRLTVMISSTARDLPEHREQVMKACLAQGMFPQMMEQLPASDAGAVAASLAMVDEADVYLGVIGWRYGTVPAGYDISITEMEYNRATVRGIPRLMFLMDEEHPVRGSDVEKGPGAVKLQVFRERLASTHVVNFFKSPEDLRAQVTNTLAKVKVTTPVPPAATVSPAASQSTPSVAPVPSPPPGKLTKLNGAQFQQLQGALLSAFDKGSLTQMMMFELDVNLSTITSNGPFATVVYELITWAQQTGNLDRLLDGALRVNPGNPDLRAANKALRG